MILRLSEQARRDVNAQIDWLAEHSPRSAEEALDEIFRVFDLLEEFPYLGMITERGWREKGVDFGSDGYVVCYVVRASDILVVRFFHARQDRSGSVSTS